MELDGKFDDNNVLTTDELENLNYEKYIEFLYKKINDPISYINRAERVDKIDEIDQTTLRLFI